ncbi:fibronectin type III domain-containing protein [Dactylosporangium sp. CA-052675]|uniref:fibronectin type III domain-containing protein n=1 Tax=Dactylosporangium sp. CA-052675 TaxID=3239927 RepID=UPI003D8EE713
MQNVSGISLVADYSAASADVGQTLTWSATLTLTGGGSYTGVNFALYLPTGVDAEAASGTTDCGATLIAISARTLVVAGASMSVSQATCVYSMPVHATQAGTYAASTGIANNTQIPTYDYSATFTAIPVPTLSATFSAATVVAGGAASLDLTLDRADTDAKSGLGYTVALPAGVTVGSASATSDCGGTLTAATGQSTIELAGATLATGVAGCTTSVPLAFSGSGVKTITGLSDVTGLTRLVNGVTTASIEVYPAVPGPQTITFAQPADVPSSTSSISVDPTSSASLYVTVTSNTTDVCTAVPVETSGRQVQILKPGICSLTATQPGNGYYAAAAAVTRTFAVIPPAPSAVTATANDSSITVSWTAASPATGITGYRATANPGPATCTTTGATTCVLGAQAGTSYTVTVVALAGETESAAAGPSAAVAPPAPVAPATPPSTNLTLTTDKGQISTTAPGADITFIGDGFAPYSTVVITMYSAPRTLGTAVTDGTGSFSKRITIPADLAAGAHTALAQGAAPDGTTRSMALALTVAERAAGSGTLPVTGAGIMLQLLIGCALAMTGTGLLWAGRTRRV